MLPQREWPVTLGAMREAGYVGSGKRKGAVDPNKHNIWWTMKAPPE